MKRSFCFWLIFLSTAVNILGQVNFQTVAEKSDFKSTSDYNDVKNIY